MIKVKNKKTKSKSYLTGIILFFSITLLLVLSSNDAQAATCNWSGTTSTAWATGTNWSCGSAPQSGDDVVINIASANQPILDLTGGITINSLSIGSSAVSTLTLSNGLVDINVNKLTITNNLTIGGSGTITHTINILDNQTHSVNISVGGDMTIADNGKIDVSNKGSIGGTSGHYNGYGTGGGVAFNSSIGGGGGYGGIGQPLMGAGGIEYGQSNIHQPTALGSGGSYGLVNGGAGGGAVKLSVSGIFTLNSSGYIYADGQDVVNSISNNAGGGSGGSIWISAGTISGSGTVRAKGGASGINTSVPGYNGGGGAGGRIAITYANDNSSNFAKTAYGGVGGLGGYGSAGSIYVDDIDDGNYGDITFDNNTHASQTRTISADYGVKDFRNFTFSEGNAGFINNATTLTITGTAPSTFGGIFTNSGSIVFPPSATSFSVAGSFTNTGPFSATSLTSFSLSSTFNNSSTFSIGDVSTLTFPSTFTNSGTFSTASTGTLTFNSAFTNSGTITVNSLATLNINNGAVTNSGSFSATNLQNFNISNANIVMDTLYSDNSTRYNLSNNYSMSLSNSATLTHTANISSPLYYLNLSISNLTIDGTSKIDVSGKGLVGGVGGEWNHRNGWPGNIIDGGGGGGGYGGTYTVNGGGGGGGYGGIGGEGQSINGSGIGAPGAEHDASTLTQPYVLGSGGGGGAGSGVDGQYPFGGTGGSGGGAVKLSVSGLISINSGGVIVANGTAGGNGIDGNYIQVLVVVDQVDQFG